MADGVKISALTETNNITGNEHIIINQDGVTKRTLISNIQGADNLTDNYVELTSDTGETYRLKVDDRGVLIAYDPEVDTAEGVQPDVEGGNTQFDGLIINQIYGTGTNILEQPLTHSFIELYNLKPTPVNLKGLYLFYRAKSGSWQSLALKGIVPSNHSFLIRGARIKEDNATSVRIPIVEYDMQWDIKMASTGFSAFLQIGNGNPGDNPVRATYTEDQQGNKTETSRNHNYIDMLAGGGSESSDQTVMAFEGYYHMAMNDHTAIMRKDFMHAGTYKPADAAQSGQSAKKDNMADTIVVDYKTCDTSKFRPRSLRDGRWSVYATKDTMNPGCPNMINMAYGKDGDTTRTFTWQSTISNMGMIKYRKQGEYKWKSKETDREIINHLDCEAMVHRVIIHGLEKGTYEYQCGQDGAWSAIETFEVKEYTENDPIDILWVTDNQSWTSEEGKACDTALLNIFREEVKEDGELNFDYVIHTGDVSQNANRTFEYRDYYASSRTTTKNMCHMMTCGNNDLVEKKYSDAWAWYITAEDQWANSVYYYDLGYTHFVCLNSNTDSTYVTGVGSIGGYTDTQKFLEAQATWLDGHLADVTRREVQPRWIIIFMHLSPFTVSRAPRLQCFVPVFEKYKIPLVLCGHNHTNSRSIPLYTGYTYPGTEPNSKSYTKNYFDYQDTSGNILTQAQVETGDAKAGEAKVNHAADFVNGTHYVMINATGYKLSGKEKIVNINAELRKDKYAGTATTKGGNVHDNGLAQPWWYTAQRFTGTADAKEGAIPKTTQPTYGMINITKDSITVTSKTIKGVLTSVDTANHVRVEPLQGTDKQTIEVFDKLVISYAQRHPESQPSQGEEQEEEQE